MSPPPVAATVRVYTPGAAPYPAEIVKVLLPTPGAAIVEGLKLAVVPTGSPLAESVTMELNPYAAVAATVVDRDCPGITPIPAAPRASVRFGDRIVRLNVRSLVVPPPTAPTVSVKTPAGAEASADKVKVLLPAPGATMLFWLKLAVTPVGTPLTERYTVESNPIPAVVVNVMGTDPPGARLALAALDARVKLGFATVTMTP